MGLVAILGGLFIEWNVQKQSLIELRKEFTNVYQLQAQSLAALGDTDHGLSDSALLAKIYKTWQQDTSHPSDAYICVVDSQSRLLLHSREPLTVGNDVHLNKLLDDQNHEVGTLGSLVSQKQSYTGSYVASDGMKQLAAFSPLKDQRWMIGVHRSSDALEKSVAESIQYQTWGFMAVILGIIPLALGLLFFSFYRSQRLLRQAEEEYQKIVETSEDLITQVDMEGNFIYVNQSANEYLGLSPKECLGKSAFDFVYEEDRAATEKWFSQWLETRSKQSAFENRQVNQKTGKCRWIQWTSQFNYDDAGTLTSFTSFGRDISNRKEAERSLLESENKYRALSEQALIAVAYHEMIYDDSGRAIDYRFLEVNESFIEMTGIDPNGMTVREAFPGIEEDPADWIGTYDKVARGGKPIRFQQYLELNDRWYDCVAYPIEPPQFVVAFLEITEQKRAEEVLEKSEEQFRLIFDTLSEGVALNQIIYNDSKEMIDYRILKTNKAFYEVADYDKNRTVIGSLATELYGMDVDTIQSWWHGAKNNKKAVSHELLSPITNQWFKIETSPIVEDQFVTTFQNITKIKAEAEELEKNITLLKSIYDNIPDAILVTNIDREIVSVNKGFTNILGYPEAEILGKKTSQIYESEAEFARQGKKRYNQSTKTKAEPYVVSYRKKNGHIFPGETLGVPILNSKNEITGYLGLIRDVSAKLEIENTLRQSQKLESLGTMIGGISHEFNNILQGMFLMGELLKSEMPDEKNLQSNLKKLLNSSKRARDIVRQILTFSRTTDFNMKPRQVQKLVHEALDLERASLPANINLEINIDEQCGYVLCDKTQIHQIVLNLCNNAIQSMEDKQGTLSVSLQPDQKTRIKGGPVSNGVKIIVSDTGKGIDSKTLERIFDPFFTTKDVGQGTGLGLSVIHGIIEGMGGEILVDSVPDKGTTVTVLLPVVEDPSIAGEKSDPDQMKDEKQISILLVDDEAEIRSAASAAIKQQGWTVETADDGAHGLEIFQKNSGKYDLVITDLVMPKMSGIDMGAAIREMNPTIPIILSTGKLSPEEEKRYKDLGIAKVIHKPWSTAQLFQLIKSLV